MKKNYKKMFEEFITKKQTLRTLCSTYQCKIVVYNRPKITLLAMIIIILFITRLLIIVN